MKCCQYSLYNSALTIGWKVLPGTNTLALLGPFISYEENEVLQMQAFE